MSQGDEPRGMSDGPKKGTCGYPSADGRASGFDQRDRLIGAKRKKRRCGRIDSFPDPWLLRPIGGEHGRDRR
jgi:hypothetical protein